MLNEINVWLEHWEPTWLLLVLGLEALSGWAGVWFISKRLNLLAQKKAVRKKKEETYESLTQGEGR